MRAYAAFGDFPALPNECRSRHADEWDARTINGCAYINWRNILARSLKDVRAEKAAFIRVSYPLTPSTTSYMYTRTERREKKSTEKKIVETINFGRVYTYV